MSASTLVCYMLASRTVNTPGKSATRTSLTSRSVRGQNDPDLYYQHRVEPR